MNGRSNSMRSNEGYKTPGISLMASELSKPGNQSKFDAYFVQDMSIALFSLAVQIDQFEDMQKLDQFSNQIQAGGRSNFVICHRGGGIFSKDALANGDVPLQILNELLAQRKRSQSTFLARLYEKLGCNGKGTVNVLNSVRPLPRR